ncbi:MAG: UDP-4-amino-4,6-dideoxy-N-acetyl-beta-L-altrosamine transaminase [Anaerolineae bacterium]|jgi:perosamine synthetase|nr:UDP-4-amino-4,6-dideoxy-N-acetyl-beta-L-altrosamine transaminase [Anaerolineae bacterium]MDX9832247.1 UDP-4-amino-4,6-dideoxy-N-acetyl-beta-L-altrosamine transaminase [Anaerolineae bacterium]
MPKLAIDGGTPVRAGMLPYGRQAVDQEDIEAVVDVLRSDWLTTGPKVAEFETAWSRTTGARHTISVSSGTAALHAAAFGAGIGRGDEVIVPALTFAASANCVLYQGGKPVFVDVQADTLNVDPAAVEAAITHRTRAIVAVDYAGQPADLDELRAISKRHGLWLIEDAAHAVGATYKGRAIGSVSDLTTFSTHPVKHVTTGEGGMITTADDTVAQRLRWFRNHGITTDHRQRAEKGGWFYEMVELGYNYRLPDINCALGLSQLRKLEPWLARRRAVAACYDAAFARLPAVRPLAVHPDREPAWHIYPILLDLEGLGQGRAQVFAALRAENIGVNVHYIPIYWHPYYQELAYPRGLCPVAERSYERLITLPLFASMTDQDVNDVVAAVTKVVEAYSA